MIAIEYAFKRKKIVAIICSVIGITYALSMGTRGPIVIIFVFLVICVWIHLNISTNKKILMMLLLALIAVDFTVSPAYRQLLTSMKRFLARNGVSTRVVDYLISGEIVSVTSGRDVIYQDLFSKLNEKPFLGYGIYGEYPLGYAAGAHNIYLEVMFHFGYPMGILLLISFVVIYIKALKKTKGKLVQSWLLLFGCMVFVKGIFGGSYLDSSVFFLLGLCLREIRCAKEKSIKTRWL
jgi:O-antigen ligase